jgi:hypothetical protein
MPFARQSRYVGDLPSCTVGPGAQATLVLAADHFSFAPSDGALVVSGSVAPDGSFAGSLVTNPPGHDRQGRASTEAFTLTVTGRLAGEVASGTYVTPRCRTEFRLSHIADAVLPWR